MFSITQSTLITGDKYELILREGLFLDLFEWSALKNCLIQVEDDTNRPMGLSER